MLRILAVFFGVLLVGVAVCVIVVLLVAHDPDLPRIDRASDYDPPRTTTVLDRNGVLLGEIARERRTVVPFERFPQILVQAVVVAEDADFYRHRGLDYLGMLRAFVANLRAGHFVQGGSTITQQVVRTFFLTPKKTIRRKLQEVVLARRLEQQFAKDEILYLYLNQIYLGHGRYGFEEASQFYFGHGVEGLTLGEATLLAGLPQAPEALTPLRHPDRAKRRQIYVIDQLEKVGTLAAVQAKEAREAPLPALASRSERVFAPEIVGMVEAVLIERFGADRVPLLGAKVTTTIDAGMQKAAREALENGLSELDRRQGYDRVLGHLSDKALARHLDRQRKNNGPTWDGVVVRFDESTKKATLDLGSRQATLDLQGEKRFAENGELKSGDLLRVRLAPERGTDALALVAPQAALVALEPATGELRAIVGGYGFVPGSFNRATRALRQPGSAFKPIVYAAAIESGQITAATVLVDSPEVFAHWRPQNYQAEPSRGPVRVRTALADSINTVAVKVLQMVGIEAAVGMARRLGIHSPLARNLSLALGASSVTPLELASAYGALAAGGKQVDPVFLLAIDEQSERRARPKGVVSQEVAYVMTDLLRSVVQEGTGKAAAKVARPVAGKTGTSNANHDAWFVGYTPDLVAAVWVGFDDPRSLGKGEVGGRAAVPIWTDFMIAALAGSKQTQFRQPAGVVVVRVDPTTGMRAQPDALDALEEVFVEGTEPQTVAPAPDEIDAETFMMEQMKSP